MNITRLTSIALGTVFVSSFFNGCGSSSSDLSDGLAQDIGLSISDFAILDLSDGSISPRTAIDDLETNAAYKTSQIVFRRVSLNNGSMLGSETTSFGFESDEGQTFAGSQDYFLAVFELTQGQWSSLASTSPWTDVLTTDLAGTVSTEDAMPAYYIDPTTVVSALNAAAFDGVSLELPTSTEWELAARAGTTTDYPWGDGLDSSGNVSDGFDDDLINANARVQESLDGTTGPLTVGSLSANAYGFYDMIGNVWEVTADYAIRGGSWRNPITQARPADIVEFDEAIAHPNVGYRLVLRITE